MMPASRAHRQITTKIYLFVLDVRVMWLNPKSRKKTPPSPAVMAAELKDIDGVPERRNEL
jgi:hypothetical protein